MNDGIGLMHNCLNLMLNVLPQLVWVVNKVHALLHRLPGNLQLQIKNLMVVSQKTLQVQPSCGGSTAKQIC